MNGKKKLWGARLAFTIRHFTHNCANCSYILHRHSGSPYVAQVRFIVLISAGKILRAATWFYCEEWDECAGHKVSFSVQATREAV